MPVTITITLRSLEKAKRILEQCDKHNITLLTCEDHRYPEISKAIPDMPILLYYKGQLLPDSTGIGIVGSRRCTDYGKEVAVDCATYLAKQDIPVISGMAKGIDSYAHTACLKADGYTAAVLGNGLDICYPSEHRSLMDQITEQGLLLSEYGAWKATGLASLSETKRDHCYMVSEAISGRSGYSKQALAGFLLSCRVLT